MFHHRQVVWWLILPPPLGDQAQTAHLIGHIWQMYPSSPSISSQYSSRSATVFPETINSTTRLTGCVPAFPPQGPSPQWCLGAVWCQAVGVLAFCLCEGARLGLIGGCCSAMHIDEAWYWWVLVLYCVGDATSTVEWVGFYPLLTHACGGTLHHCTRMFLVAWMFVYFSNILKSLEFLTVRDCLSFRWITCLISIIFFTQKLSGVFVNRTVLSSVSEHTHPLFFWKLIWWHVTF